jgi:dephospho-CoA kinase
MLKVGLTGGIACGKSHVLCRLAEAGFAVLDLDVVAHEVVAPGGPAYADVVAAFGPSILDPSGVIDRKVLGARVFSDASARERLNAIVHPRIREAERSHRARLKDAEVLIVDAALLVETGAHLRFDRLVVVDCPPEEQVRRLGLRDGLDERAARARIEAQMPTAEKRRFAHRVLDASGSAADTDREVAALVAELRGLAASPPSPVKPSLEQALAALAALPEVGPRGLRPQDLLAMLSRTGAPEMPALAAQLDPPAKGPWYEAGRESPAALPPELLSVPLVLWSLARRGIDPPFLLGAAYSLARLTHHDPSDLAGACLFALLLQEAAVSGRAVPSEAEWTEWSGWATRWGGGAPPQRVPAAALWIPRATERIFVPAHALLLAGLLHAMAGGSGAERASASLRQAMEDLWRRADSFRHEH